MVFLMRRFLPLLLARSGRPGRTKRKAGSSPGIPIPTADRAELLQATGLERLGPAKHPEDSRQSPGSRCADFPQCRPLWAAIRRILQARLADIAHAKDLLHVRDKSVPGRVSPRLGSLDCRDGPCRARLCVEDRPPPAYSRRTDWLCRHPIRRTFRIAGAWTPGSMDAAKR